MSTVLWTNHLSNGEVTSDERDKWALYRHIGKLDKLAKAAKLEPFSDLLDHADLQFNMGNDDLPDGITSTDELMTRDGV